MPFGAEVLFAALIVGLDNFAVAIALGALGARRRALRVSLTFAALGGAAPAVGALLGSHLAGRLAGLGEAAAAVVLVAVGVWTIRTGLRPEKLERTVGRLTSGGGLIALGAGMSSDNFAVGLGLGLHGTPSLPLALATAVSVFLLTQLGLRLGLNARKRWEQGALIAAGLLLLALAASFVFG